jgi:hypothetical protein
MEMSVDSARKEISAGERPFLSHLVATQRENTVRTRARPFRQSRRSGGGVAALPFTIYYVKCILIVTKPCKYLFKPLPIHLDNSPGRLRTGVHGCILIYISTGQSEVSHKRQLPMLIIATRNTQSQTWEAGFTRVQRYKECIFGLHNYAQASESDQMAEPNI